MVCNIVQTVCELRPLPEQHQALLELLNLLLDGSQGLGASPHKLEASITKLGYCDTKTDSTQVAASADYQDTCTVDCTQTIVCSEILSGLDHLKVTEKSMDATQQQSRQLDSCDNNNGTKRATLANRTNLAQNEPQLSAS